MSTPKPNTMKRLITLLLFLISISVAAQYNNEWIKHTQTYFKFKIVNKGLYRIPKLPWTQPASAIPALNSLNYGRMGRR